MKRLLSTQIGSALVGGAIVGAFFWTAIAAGWIESDGGSTTTVSAPLTTPASSRDDDGNGNLVNEIYRRDGKGVAFIAAKGISQSQEPSPFGQPEGRGASSGSGFLIDEDGHVITNSHVVEGASTVSVTLGTSDRAYDAEIVGTDPATDVALLKIDADAEDLHPLQLGDSTEVEVGDQVIAIGNPFGLDQTVTAGIVSALQRQIQAPNGFSISHVIQTDAAINPGNSGGPLIDSSGRVIGINSQIQTGGSSGNVGIGFAVPINTAKDVVSQLQEDGSVSHAYLGIKGGSITPELAEILKLPVKRGVLVNSVVPGGPAEEAGLEGGDTSATIEGASVELGGDIITEVDGERVTDMEEVIAKVNASKPGDEMRLKVHRDDGEVKVVVVTLGERPDSAEDVQSGQPSR